ncbi:hypothetical protein D3C73_657310 [compost metagenome]
MGFLDGQPVRQNRHLAFRPGIRPGRLERLIHFRNTLNLDKRAEAGRGYVLIGNVRGRKFHNRRVFVAHPKAANRLTPVHIEGPHRNPLQSRKTGQETGERLTLMKLLDYKVTGIKIIMAHKPCLLKNMLSVNLIIPAIPQPICEIICVAIECGGSSHSASSSPNPRVTLRTFSPSFIITTARLPSGFRKAVDKTPSAAAASPMRTAPGAINLLKCPM